MLVDTFFETGSHVAVLLGWPHTHYDLNSGPSCLVYIVLLIKLRASNIPGRFSTTDLDDKLFQASELNNQV